LVTNALKYAFPDGRSGQVVVELKSCEVIELSVRDGIGATASGQPEGLGSRILSLLAQQLEGRLLFERLDPGVRVVLRAPRKPLSPG
jgi:two-component system, sensor histidine kinase PdtaS